MVFPDPDAEELAAARMLVRRAFGADLEAKASDAFCIAHSRRVAAAGLRFGVEELAAQTPGVAPSASVVEFVTDANPADPSASVRWPRLHTQIEHLRAALPGGSPLRASGLLRQAFVAAVRNARYRVVTPVYVEIERLSGGPMQPGPETVGAQRMPSLITQVCWLNSSLRTWAGPASLAEVAADRSVSGIDVPRRLMPDAVGATSRVATAIGLPAFRGKDGPTGRGVTVAVIDTEAAVPPSLADRVVRRRNYTAEPWGNPAAHGTAVAGIIGAADPDHPGVAPGVTIYNYKVLATNRFLHGDDFGGTLAIQQALEDGCQIANCSWGAGPAGTAPSRAARAVDAATGLGMAVVKSAGNAGPGPATMTTPAESLTAIVVGATDLDGTAVAPYSSRGPAGARTGPDVVAPGGSQADPVVSALVGGGFGPVGAGTSFAAPLVTGALALLLERSPDLLPADLLDWVRAHAKPLAGFDPADDGQGVLALT